MNNQLDIIPIYRNGTLDRKYFYTEQAKRYLKAKAIVINERIDLLFTEYRFTPLDTK